MTRDKRIYSYLLSIIYCASMNMTDDVFSEYVNHPEWKEFKPIYNLFAEAFLSLKSFCLLMFNNAWTQAGAILRVAIEEISSLYVLIMERQDLIQEYLKLLELKKQYWHLEGEEEKERFRKEHSIKNKNNANTFFDYAWFRDSAGGYGHRQIIRAAHLEQVEADINEELNQFAHGKLSIFEFYNEKEGWGLMKRFGRRMNAICYRLFDYLCCSYKCWVGDSFHSKPIDNRFLEFKECYLQYLEETNDNDCGNGH